eukprot:g20105.t1
MAAPSGGKWNFWTTPAGQVCCSNTFLIPSSSQAGSSRAPWSPRVSPPATGAQLLRARDERPWRRGGCRQ